MIDIKNSGATQLTMKGGVLSEWKVTLDGEELYTLPSDFTVQNTFEIRRIIEKMMVYAHTEGLNEMALRKDKEIEQLLETGNAQLDALKDENLRIATAFEKHMLSATAY